MNTWTQTKLQTSIKELTYFDLIKTKQVFDFFSLPDIGKIRNYLNERRFSMTHSNQNYRTVRHWENEGLFNSNLTTMSDTNEKIKGWRKFSLVELTWITMIGYMREFGLQLQVIKPIATQLNILNDKKGSEYPLLEYFFWQIMTHHIPVFMKIYADGRAKITTDEDYILNCEKEGSSNHLIISLNRALKENFPNNFKVDPIYYSGHKIGLKPNEMELIKELRKGDYQTVKVRLKDGEVDLFEGVEQVETNERIVDLLRSGEFQDIDIKQENGRVVSIKKTKKKRL